MGEYEGQYKHYSAQKKITSSPEQRHSAKLIDNFPSVHGAKALFILSPDLILALTLLRKLSERIASHFPPEVWPHAKKRGKEPPKTASIRNKMALFGPFAIPRKTRPLASPKRRFDTKLEREPT